MAIPQGWHNTADATADAVDVHDGDTVYARGEEITGTQTFSISGNTLICPTDWYVIGDTLYIPDSWFEKK